MTALQHAIAGLVVASHNPLVFQVLFVSLLVLAASAAVELALGLLDVALRPRHPLAWLAVVAPVGMLALGVLLLVLTWWAFATPYGALPFTLPAQWLRIGLVAVTYTGAAIVGHLLLILLISILLSLFWALPLGFIVLQDHDSIRWHSFALVRWIPLLLLDVLYGLQTFALALLLLIFPFLVGLAVEVNQWPVTVVVVVEWALLAYIGFAAGSIITSVAAPRNAQQKVRRERIGRVVTFVLLAGGGLAILCLHAVNVYLINAAGVFLSLCCLDPLVAAASGVRQPAQVQDTVLWPRRWLLTIPVLLALTLVAAAGILQPISVNTQLTASLWLECGGAAAVFCLFRPLTTLAAYRAGTLATTRNVSLSDLFGLLNRISPVIRPAASTNQSADADGKQDASASSADPAPGSASDARARARSAQRSSSDGDNLEDDQPDENAEPEDTLRDAASTLRGAQRDLYKTATRFKDRKLQQQLAFPAVVVFGLGLLLYHYLASTFALGSVFTSSLGPVLLSVVGLVAGLLPIFTERTEEPSRNVSLIVLFVVLVVTGIYAIFNAVLGQTPPSSISAVIAGRASFDLLNDQRYFVYAGHLLAQQMLFLVVAGQLSYLYQVFDVKLASDQKSVHAVMWTELAAIFRDDERPHAALDGVDRAIELEKSAERLTLQGDLYERMHQHHNALASYKEALQLAPNYARALYGEAVVCRAEGDIKAALSRLQRAIIYADESERPGYLVEKADLLLERAGKSARAGHQDATHADYLDALAAAEAAHRLDSKNADALVAMSNALDALDHGLEAYQARTEALKLGLAQSLRDALERANQAYLDSVVEAPTKDPATHGTSPPSPDGRDRPGDFAHETPASE